MLTGGILIFGIENISRYALQFIYDLSMCYCCKYSFYFVFKGYAAMFDAYFLFLKGDSLT